MALIKCAECGKEVSDKAKTCINCGAPIVNKKFKKKEFRELNWQEKKEILNIMKSENVYPNKLNVSYVFMGIAFIPGVFAIFNALNGPNMMLLWWFGFMALFMVLAILFYSSAMVDVKKYYTDKVKD